jgi:hypothetical protein
MPRLARSILLGMLTTLALAWLLAALVPVPMYPRRVARVWLDRDGRAVSSAEVSLPGVLDIWWDDVKVPPGTTESQAVAAQSDHLDTLAAERRGTEQRMRRREGPPPLGTFRGETPADTRSIGSDTAFGLPFPCLWYSVRSQVRNNALVGETLVGGVSLSGAPSARGRDFRALPLRPAWLRLGANIACWSLAWWLAGAAVAWRRGRRRRRRGQCERCGYSLAGLAGVSFTTPACPECGAARAACDGVTA